MRLKGRQFRFVVGSLAAWSGMRAVAWWGGTVLAGLAALAGLTALERLLPWGDPPVPVPFSPAPLPAAPRGVRVTAATASRPEPDIAAPERSAGMLRLALAAAHPGSTAAALRRATFAAAPPSAEEAPGAPLDQPAGMAAYRPGGARDGRWAASLFLFGRPGHEGASLAEGGQLGGSQLALRLAYRLNPGGTVRTAAAVRLYVPLGTKGAEAAAGLDWYPRGGVPLRLTVERRVGLDQAGRDAWSAYAAGGFYREPAAGRVVVDGYGQAGVVGLRSRDPFVDGAVRVGAKLPLGHASLQAGGGVWGAAQPDLARLDLGPRTALTVPVADRAFTLAVEGRFRVAGHARPGSGVALTFGTDL